MLALAAATSLAGCRQNQPDGCRPDPAADAPGVPITLKHLEKPFFQIKNAADGLQFLKANPRFARQFLRLGEVSADTLASALAQLAADPSLQVLNQETAAAFPDSAGLQREVAAMFGRVKYYFPDFKPPLTTVTFVSGLHGQGIFVNDSLLSLNLDWFVGPKASYRPKLPQYMLRRYKPADVLPGLATSVANKYNKHDITATSMLDHMVDEGKHLYFASRMLPCTPDSLIMGYTPNEIRDVRFNEGKVWGHFLENKLLYSTAPFIIQKYVGERPNVPEISRLCPGRIGQWVGLQIVRKYMDEHPDVTLAKLMAEKDAQRILNDSHYRPKK